jgi:predicted nucleic acid-binding protein
MTAAGLAFDSSPLNYFARSNQLPTLGKLVEGSTCIITRAVEDELLRGGSKHAQLYQISVQPWLTVVDDSSMEFLRLFSEYHSRLGGGGRNIGEAATLAYAELHGLTAFVDDRVGRRQGQERGVIVTGTLELICQGMREHAIEESEARDIIDLLCDHEAFLPCDGAGFLDWARAEGLLE